MTEQTDDIEFGFEDDGICMCPRCMGAGEIDCHCGGDLCVCMNFGDAECPLCHGEGEISQALWDNYFAKCGGRA
jgi:hypothetical protein